ncbi:DUF4012 domain-containing protein [Candidatus Uhrbacteria bacterium]|nr:DUF4012 domain-containing protein [Candidatus Uhrbacteria bacterium]
MKSTASFSPKKRRLWPWIVAAVVAILLVAVVPPGIALVRAGIAAQAARSSLKSAEQHLRAMDIEAAQEDVRNAAASVETFRAALRGVGFWRDVPLVGTQIRAFEDVANAGAGTLDSASDLLEVASVIVDALRGGTEAASGLGTGIAPTRSFDDLTKEEKRDLLRRLDGQLPRLRLARDKMDLALVLWNRVPQDRLVKPVRDALAPFAAAIPTLQRSLTEAIPLIEVLVPLAGYPDPRHYLMALQNADEIRPAGGFIGTIGLMSWDAGDMPTFLFTDVYGVDNPVSGVWKETPPEPLRRYLGVDNWFLRDANWSPDFPTSAGQVLDFFIRESEMQLHGPLPARPTTFIAFQPGFFESLLRLTGPITVEGQTYTADDFFEKLEFEVEVGWHQRGIPVEKRKEIVSKLGDEIRARLFALPAARWPEILDLVTQALERKQILAYAQDAELQGMFDARGWSGRTRPTDGDFLQVVDANLAALKTDGAMRKAVRYAIDATAPGGPIATVTLTYTNTAQGFSDYRYTRYRSYTRVYVPEGSELVSSEGAMKDDLNKTGNRFVPGTVDVMRELGKTVFGAFWSVEPGKTGKLSFTYRLPEDVADRLARGEYRLDWQKQPGVDGMELTLDLAFGKNIASATPSEEESRWGDARYQVEADSLVDRTFITTFSSSPSR